MQGLQQRNLELLTVVRQLGAEKEQGKVEAEQEMAKRRELTLAGDQERVAERTSQQVAHRRETCLCQLHGASSGRPRPS